VRICSITPHQLLNNPRIVREADAFAAAGHEVRVISVRKTPEDTAYDAAIAAGRPWRWQSVDVERTPAARWRWLATGARQKGAAALWRGVRRGTALAARAYARTYSETIRLAISEPADLIVAHTQPMLAPAAAAARRLGCPWTFDCEDLLSEEYGEGIVDDSVHQAMIQRLERRFLREADAVTVASPEFGPWLEQHYGVRRWTPIANVPPLAECPDAIRPGYPSERTHLSLYWVSMSAGPLRGLEDAVRALPLIAVPAQLHIRGRMLPGYEGEIRALAASLGVADRVHCHGLVPAADLVRTASAHDVGLALTQPCCVNADLAVANKIYTYMAAGLAVAATSTRGHRTVMSAAPGAGVSYAPGDHAALAAGINELARDPGRLQAARAEAFRLARSRFNWDVEQQVLLDAIARIPAAAEGACVAHSGPSPRRRSARA
jgi:glycosyltransferase involved in cell wall biosynthesis